MLRNLDPEEYNIALIQELVINMVNLTIANPKWNVVYPTTHNRDCTMCTQSVILINKLISKDNWEIVPVDSPDISAIEIQSDSGNTHIYNVYNNITHNETLITLEKHFTDTNTNAKPCMDGLLLMGDFNRHHPMWDEARNQYLFTAANLKATQPLLDLLVTHDLIMALPEDIPTLEANSIGNHTHPDNVFCTAHIIKAITTCNV